MSDRELPVRWSCITVMTLRQSQELRDCTTLSQPDRPVILKLGMPGWLGVVQSETIWLHHLD